MLKFLRAWWRSFSYNRRKTVFRCNEAGDGWFITQREADEEKRLRDLQWEMARSNEDAGK